ncbi:TY-Chap2 family putative peptide chaperone [Microbacterium sp. A204]|uniref:TY-Chap2 family putative peptide chaperone n=1 Tax=Microbacterium sp. A204 TaxID=3457321 RepID=UPI003FD1AF91
MSEGPGVSARHKIAAYWWLASELVRRHPELNVAETYPMDGFYDCVSVGGKSGDRDILIEMNREGSIHVHPAHSGFMAVEQVISHDDPLRAVRSLEQVAGLAKGASVSSGSRIITHRLIARVLTLVVNDVAEWDVRMLTRNGFGHSLSLFDRHSSPLFDVETNANEKGHFSSIFPTEALFHSFLISSKAEEDVDGRLWALKKDGMVVAIFDTRGYVYTREQRASVKPLYARLGRSLTLTAVHALGGILP